MKKLVAKLAKSFGIHTRHTESLGDFRYNSRPIAVAPNRTRFTNVATVARRWTPDFTGEIVTLHALASVATISSECHSVATEM